MFDNLTREILYYSVIPFVIIAIITLFLLLKGKKEENRYKYNYFIKMLLYIIIALVLPLITGYSFWVYKYYVDEKVTLFYMIVLGLLIVSLVTILIIITRKIYKSFKEEPEQIKTTQISKLFFNTFLFLKYQYFFL